jgi:hypothetical protein
MIENEMPDSMPLFMATRFMASQLAKIVSKPQLGSLKRAKLVGWAPSSTMGIKRLCRCCCAKRATEDKLPGRIPERVDEIVGSSKRAAWPAIFC